MQGPAVGRQPLRPRLAQLMQAARLLPAPVRAELLRNSQPAVAGADCWKARVGRLDLEETARRECRQLRCQLACAGRQMRALLPQMQLQLKTQT